MTSIASSASETRSVCFGGQEMTLEQALDRVIKDSQSCLNSLQESLRNLAALEEQEIDEDEDFKGAVELEDRTVDLVDMMTNILRELVPIAADIRGSCPKTSKEWYAAHKLTTKERRAREKAARAAAGH
jgi:hypothetical protein